MSGKFKQAFQGQRGELSEMISADLDLLLKLEDEGIISSDERQQILSPLFTPRQQSLTLLDLLVGRRDDQFETFCDILQKRERKDVVKKLLSNLQHSANVNECDSNDRRLDAALATGNITPSVTVVSSGKGVVIGISVVRDELLVLRNPSHQQVEIYVADTAKFKRVLRIPTSDQSNSAWGLAAGGVDDCVYIGIKKRIHRIELENESHHKEWSLKAGFHSRGLSITVKNNLLCSGSYKLDEDSFRCTILEYSTQGLLIRQIDLSQVQLYHAVEIHTSDQFLVTNRVVFDSTEDNAEDPIHRVCLISSEGKLIRSYGTDHRSYDRDPRYTTVEDAGSLDEPVQLAIVPTGEKPRDFEIYVTSKSNNRIVVLTSDLSWSRDLELRELKLPRAIFFDRTRGRLYVGESAHSRNEVCRVLSMDVARVTSSDSRNEACGVSQ